MLIPLTRINFITVGRDHLQRTETELFLINPQHIITVESTSRTFNKDTEEEITHKYSVILYGNNAGGGTKFVTESLFDINRLIAGHSK